MKVVKKLKGNEDSEEEEYFCIGWFEPYSNSRAIEKWVQSLECKHWAHEAYTGGATFLCLPQLLPLILLKNQLSSTPCFNSPRYEYLNCLAPGHSAFRCNLPLSCRICKARHHSLLHKSTKANASASLELKLPMTLPQKEEKTLATMSNEHDQ
ncbi:unnamed protein product [Pieris brassicae]|uniref:Uncharacterized protein n=1 Tax=Pieris brassicae TaxID=7116 RepID=A0A9P0TQJ4_PIEBR|nr:unnamed protein product [Pieris brassicae]